MGEGNWEKGVFKKKVSSRDEPSSHWNKFILPQRDTYSRHAFNIQPTHTTTNTHNQHATNTQPTHTTKPHNQHTQPKHTTNTHRGAVERHDDLLPELGRDAEEAAEQAQRDEVERIEQAERVEAGRAKGREGQPGIAPAHDVDQQAPAPKVEAQADAHVARVAVGHRAVRKDRPLLGVVQEKGQVNQLRLDLQLLKELCCVVCCVLCVVACESKCY